MRKLWALALPFALFTAGCVSHPVGPARTFGKYEGKAVTSAESVLSAVESARLVAKTAAKGNAFGPYLATMGSEAEDAASGVQGTFSSIQPPDGKADALRRSLLRLMDDAVSHLADLRIALRRGEGNSATRVARPLDVDAKRLTHFIEEHQS